MTIMREKTLSYRRAQWFSASNITLERCLRDTYKALKSVADRTIIYGAHCVRNVKQQDATGGGLFIHLTAEIPGEPASIVPKAAPGKIELDLKTAAPPTDGEWLDGDAFFFVKDDHVCMCATDIHDGAIKVVLDELFKKAKLRKDSTRFGLMKVADISKVKMLHKQGVKELEIRATLFKATADYEKRKAQALGAAGAVGKHIRAILGRPHDVTHDGLRVFLTIKTDRRFGKSALILGEQRIETLAADVVNNRRSNDDYDYVILTNTGQRITPKEIFMRSKAAIESDGNTVRCDKAWKELKKFFDGLSESGALEQ